MKRLTEVLALKVMQVEIQVLLDIQHLQELAVVEIKVEGRMGLEMTLGLHEPLEEVGYLLL